MSDRCEGYQCPPSTSVDLPECEQGWEIGNGTAVCATQQPNLTDLAVTGGEVEGSMVVLAVVLIVLGGIGMFGRMVKRGLR